MLCLHVLAIKSIFSTCLVSNHVAWKCPEGRVHCKKYRLDTLGLFSPGLFLCQNILPLSLWVKWWFICKRYPNVEIVMPYRSFFFFPNWYFYSKEVVKSVQSRSQWFCVDCLTLHAVRVILERLDLLRRVMRSAYLKRLRGTGFVSVWDRGRGAVHIHPPCLRTGSFHGSEVLT